MEKWDKRPFSRATPLCHGLEIIHPEDADGLAAAERLAAATGGRTVPQGACPPPEQAQTPALLLGNLANNRQVAALYTGHLLFADLAYPGPGGWTLRTLVDPFATGHNLLHLGYSDGEGLAAGLAALLALLGEHNRGRGQNREIPWLCRMHTQAQPWAGQPGRFYAQAPLDMDGPAAYYVQPVEQKGAVAYFTGDAAALREYHDAWRILLQTGCEVEDIHLRLKNRAFIWLLLEAHGMLEDWLCAQGAAFFHRWLCGPEGVRMIEFENYQTDGYPRQNHGLLPALGILHLCAYYSRHYPGLPQLEEWQKLAQNVFAPYQSGSWKPICDGLCHGWAMSQPPMVEHALLYGGGYVQSGGLAKAADCAIAVTNNTGWMPESGDSSLAWAQNGGLLAAAAHLYDDGRYLFAKNLAPARRQGNLDWVIWLPREFARGIQPVLPRDHIGWKVIPMDPLVYGAADALPRRAAGPWGAFTRPPQVPLAQAFDKISWRSGFGPQDEYLLLDGLGGGSHSYDDALSIVDYQRFGVDFLIAADGLRASEAENHSMVTVYRNGEQQDIPSFAALEFAREADGAFHLAASLPDVGGCLWRRQLFILPGGFVAVQDTITAGQAGQYSICCRWRTPGPAALLPGDAGGLAATRRAPGGGEVYFRIVGGCSHAGTRRIVKRPLADPKIFAEATPDAAQFPQLRKDCLFAERYGLGEDENFISSLEHAVNTPLQAGEDVVFTHVFHAALQVLPAALEAGGDGCFRVHFGGEAVPTPLAAHALAPLLRPVDAPQAALRAAAAFAAPVTACEEAGGAVLLGLENGELWRYDGKNAPARLAALAAPIHSLAAQEGRVFVGFGQRQVACLQETGGALWQREIQRRPTLYPWWELPAPTPVALRMLPWQGGWALGAGCGDDGLKYLSPRDGQLLESFYFRIGVSDHLLCADVNGDGRPEAIAASGLLGCQSAVRVLDDKANVLAEFGDEGWVSRTTALRVFTVDGRPAIGQGVNHRRNFRLCAPENGQVRTLLEKSVLGEVTALQWWQAAGLYVGGSSEGTVFAYSLENGPQGAAEGAGGVQRWLRFHQSPVQALHLDGEKLLVLEENGLTTAVDARGQALAAVQLPPGSRWRAFGDALLVISGQSVALLRDVAAE